MAQLIKHVFDVDPGPFGRFFAAVTRNRTFQRKPTRIEAEVEFQLRKRIRRADLVVYVENKPRLLIELKYRDRLRRGGKAKSSQLSDYIDLCRRLPSRPRFVLLHKGMLEFEDEQEIRRARQFVAHFGALAPFLKSSEIPASSMLFDYLRDEGLVIEPIETDQLYRFMHRLVLPSGGSGRINRTSTVDEGPVQFQRLLSNLRLLAADITAEIKFAAGMRGGRSATVDFGVRNFYRTRRIKAISANENGRELELDASTRMGGIIDVWAQNALAPSPHWLYVSYGFEFHLAFGKPISCEPYVCLYSPEVLRASKGNVFDERFSFCGTLPIRSLSSWKKGDLEDEFVRLIRRVARSTLRANVITNRRSKFLLRRLEKGL